MPENSPGHKVFQQVIRHVFYVMILATIILLAHKLIVARETDIERRQVIGDIYKLYNSKDNSMENALITTCIGNTDDFHGTVKPIKK